MNNRWAILVLLFVVRLSFAYQFQSVGAVSPLLVEAWSIDYASLGILVSLYMLPGVVLALPGGMIGGRIGDRQMVIAGLGLMAIGGVVTGMAETYTTAVVGRLIAGVGGVLLNVLMTKMVMDWFAGREIVTALAFYITSWPAGIAIALYTLAPFAEAVSLPAVFFLTAALNLVGLAALWALYRQPPGASDGMGARAATSRLLPREIWLVVLVTMVWMSYSTLYLVLMSFAPSFLVERGLTVVDAAALTGVAAALYAISTPVFGFVSDRVKRPVPIVVVSLLLMIAGFAAIPIFPTAGWLFVAIGIVGGIPQGILKSLPVEVLRPEARATGMGLHFTIHYFGYAAAPPLVGFIADVTGRVEASILSASVLGMIALVCYLWSRVEVRRLPLPATAEA